MEDERRTRRPALDGIRGIAVLLVLVGHAAPSIAPGGVFGVDVFFVLSGYLITSILSEGLRLTHFWSRRVRRLLPPLGVVLSAIAVLLAWLGDGGRVREWRLDIFSVLSYTTNWRMLTKGVPYDQLASGASPFVHLWSVAVEEQFYLLWPLVLAVPFFRARVRVAAATLVLAGVAMAAFLLFGGASLDRLWFGTDVRAAQLGAGALLATLRSWRPPSPAGWAGALFLAAAVALCGAGVRAGVAGMVLATIGTFLVISAVECNPGGLLARVLSWRPVVFAGVISYGVYLWHVPLLWVLHRIAGAPVNVQVELVYLSVTLCGSLFVGAVSWRFLESPLLGRSRRPPGPRRAVLLSVGVFLLGGVVAVGVTRERGVYREQKEGSQGWSCPEGSPVCAFLETGRPDAWECRDYMGCELFIPESPSKTVIIAGDSVMRSLAPAMIDEARERNWRLVGLVRNCGPHDLRGGMLMVKDGSMRMVEDPTTAICPEFPHELGQAIDAWNADLVIAGNGRSREAYRSPGSGDFVVPDDDRYAGMYKEAVQRVHREAHSRGVPLAIVLMVEPVEPPGCVDALVQYECTLFNPLDTARPAALAERAAQRESFSGLPGVTLFDPAPIVCPSVPCPSIDGGYVWRYDGIHYSFDSAKVVVRSLLDALDHG